MSVEFWIMVGAAVVSIICGLLLVAFVIGGRRRPNPEWGDHDVADPETWDGDVDSL